MDGPRDDHTKWSRSDRERQIAYITYMWNLKKTDKNEFIYKTEADPQTLKTKLCLLEGKVGRDKLGIWNNRYILLHIKWMNGRNLLCSAGNYIQCLVVNYESESYSLSRVWLFATPWTVVYPVLWSWISSGKCTGVGSYSLLQGIFLTQGSNMCLLHLLVLAGRFFTIWATMEAPWKPILKGNLSGNKFGKSIFIYLFICVCLNHPTVHMKYVGQLFLD